jgi:hypothetical protein
LLADQKTATKGIDIGAFARARGPGASGDLVRMSGHNPHVPDLGLPEIGF